MAKSYYVPRETSVASQEGREFHFKKRGKAWWGFVNGVSVSEKLDGLGRSG